MTSSYAPAIASLRQADDLFAALAGVTPGSQLAITLVRGTEELTVTATWPAAG